MPCYAPNKMHWFPVEIKFLRENYLTMTNDELVQEINKGLHPLRLMRKVNLPTTRHLLRRMGCLRIKQDRWLKKETKMLLAWYPLMGDVEIAFWLTRVSKKKRVFTNKNVSKKRQLLELHRTPEQIKRIREDNALIGKHNTSRKSWATRRRRGTFYNWKVKKQKIAI